MKKILMYFFINRQQHTSHLASFRSLGIIIIFLFAITYTDLLGPFSYGYVPSVHGTNALHFTPKQLDRLYFLVESYCKNLSEFGYFLDGRAWFRSLDGLLFDKVQRWVLNYFPQLHQAALDAWQLGVKFDAREFLRGISIQLPGPLGLVPEHKLIKFCEVYNCMICDWMTILEAFRENRDIDPEVLKRFLGQSGYADYLIHHSKSELMERMEEVMRIRKVNLSIWPPKGR